MANHRISTNTSNSSVTAQDKTKRKTKETKKLNKINQFRISALQQVFLKISARPQTASAAETHLAVE
jgi:hypothetical protein